MGLVDRGESSSWLIEERMIEEFFLWRVLVLEYRVLIDRGLLG